MKMSRFEKVFVNRTSHARHVALRTGERLKHLNLSPGQRYLDVGCGNGASAIHVAQTLGLDVTGIDVDPEQVRAAENAAKGIRGVTFRQGDATHLPFPDGFFDSVSTNKTTHHIPRWKEALAEMTRVVKPGGHIVCADLTVPVWMAGLLKPILGRSAGVFTRRDLDDRFHRLGLQPVGESASGWIYKAVFRKLEEGFGMTHDSGLNTSWAVRTALGEGR